METGDLDKDINIGYIPFNFKEVSQSDNNKKIVVSYMDMSKDISLEEGKALLTLKFKVKSDAAEGNYTFKLHPVNLLDSSGRFYNVNDNKPATSSVEIVNAASIEGYVSIFLGGDNKELHSLIQKGLKQEAINKTFKNLTFTLSKGESSSSAELKGSEVFVPDTNGNLAAVDNNGNVIGKFSILTKDISLNLLKISGVGYLPDTSNIKLILGETSNVSTSSSPIVLYPGDVGGIEKNKLVTTSDGIINNIDFSAWLELYKANLSGKASNLDKIRADFTKDGVIDNVDFSLWMAVYRKQFIIKDVYKNK